MSTVEQVRLFPEPPAAVTLHYWRYFRQYTEEFGTVEDAVRSAAWQSDEGQIAYDHLEFADGTVMDHDELERRVDAFHESEHPDSPG